MTKLNPEERAVLALEKAKREIASIIALRSEDYEVLYRHLNDAIGFMLSPSRHRPLIRVELTKGTEPF
jgi:hypothetical protein